uniref:Uncharacterized protein n=1 Tax=Trypanosoma congolense (strain IL3000) TaxID=1068625 RepID=G0UYA9_TRYCI|nr:conserved hypothetical protein [Trypanosoma congolense IL3000]
MQPSSAVLGSKDRDVGEAKLSFAGLTWCISQYISCVYTQEHDTSEVKEAKFPKLLPRVVFRVSVNAESKADEEDPPEESTDPLPSLCSAVKALCSSGSLLAVKSAPTEAAVCARRCLQRACATLRDSELGTRRRQTAPGCGPRGVARCSSSSGVDISGCEEAVRCIPHTCDEPPVGNTEHPFLLVYSSEDGTSRVSGDCHSAADTHNERKSACSIREAYMVIHFLAAVAFSCPCEPLAKCLQVVMADVLLSPICPPSLRSCILKCLCPLDADVAAAVEKAELSEAAESVDLFYVVNGNPTNVSLEALPLALSHEHSDVRWYVAPSPTAALFTIEQLLSGKLSKELEAMLETRLSNQETAFCVLPSSSSSPSLTRKRLGGLPKSRPNSSGFLDTHLPKDEEKEVVARRKVWEALCQCDFISLRSVCAERDNLLYRVFTETGEVPQYYYILSICPSILSAHDRAFRYIFFGGGPLSVCERLMVAFMTACRQRCEYLVCRFGALLVRVSNEERSVSESASIWLLRGPPPRLQALQRFIAIATHVPWQISDSEIRTAMSAGWSIPGLMQVSAIVAETLSLSSFVMGLFVPNDLWAFVSLPPALAAMLSPCAPLGGDHRHNGSINFALFTGLDNIVSENRIKGSFVGGSTLRSGNFNWHEHGGTLMEQYYPGAAALMNDEFDAFATLIRRLNHSDCVGLMSPEYPPSYAFQSLLLYVQNIIGFMSDNYHYNDINKVLRRPAKLIAHTCTMRPETMSRAQLRLWAQPSAEQSGSPGGVPSHTTQDSVERQSSVERGVDEQRRQLIESLDRHRAPFTLTLPSDLTRSCKCPQDDVIEKALRLHEEWLVLILLLATMEARKEGLLALLLHPMWKMLNNM